MSGHEYRDDSWPLCPRCGEDELWSRALFPQPTDPLRCYQCNWTGSVPPARWRVVREPQSVHTVPIADAREHVLRSDCWCAPRVEQHARLLVIHFAADGRELVEAHGLQ